MKNGCLLVLAVLVVSVVPAQQPDDAKAKVKSLIDLLDNGPDAKRVAAEWELLKLGPDILTLLPPADPKDRLTPIRATLEELLPRTFEAKQKSIPLASALQELKKGTGLELVDRRQSSKGGDVNLDLGKATYWQAVQALCNQTDSRLSLYQPDGKVALVDGPISKQQVQLHGPFMVAVKRIDTRLDFETGTRTGRLGLEIAWEPRFQPYLIEVGKLTFTASEPGATDASGPVFVTERNAREFDVAFAAPGRGVAALVNVAGHFVVTMPSKSLAFTFAKAEAGVKKVSDGVELTIKEVDSAKDWWTVELIVDVPAAGPRFDSFQTWLGGGAWLDRCSFRFERGAGENTESMRAEALYTQVLPTPSATQARVRFKVAPRKNAGKPEAWRLVCNVPGRLVEVRVPFSFERIDLP